MDWIEVVVHTTTEGADVISALLCEAGAAGAEIIDRQDVLSMPQAPGMWDLIDESVLAGMPEDVLVKAYFEENAAAPEVLTLLEARLLALGGMEDGLELGTLAMERAAVHDEDWSERWKQYYKPFRVGKRLVVKPSWEHYAPRLGDLIVEMDPGMAFGTGTHETTSLCMELLERFVTPGCACIDVGTGTGILAIAASMLGAAQVQAIDLDADAVRVAHHNIEQNGRQGTVQVRQGDLLKETVGKANVIVANIIADVICALAVPVRAHLLPGGTWICSGIIRERERDVLDALGAAGYTVIERLGKGEWVCLAAQ